MAPRPARIRSGPESVDEALAALDHYAASRCPRDTDGDGDCAACARRPEGCFEQPGGP